MATSPQPLPPSQHSGVGRTGLRAAGVSSRPPSWWGPCPGPGCLPLPATAVHLCSWVLPCRHWLLPDSSLGQGSSLLLLGLPSLPSSPEKCKMGVTSKKPSMPTNSPWLGLSSLLGPVAWECLCPDPAHPASSLSWVGKGSPQAKGLSRRGSAGWWMQCQKCWQSSPMLPCLGLLTLPRKRACLCSPRPTGLVPLSPPASVAF